MIRKNLKTVKKLQAFRMLVLVLTLCMPFACKKKDCSPMPKENARISYDMNAANASSSKESVTSNGKYVVEPASGKSLDDVEADAKAAGAKIIRVQKQLGYVVVQSSSETFKADFAKKKSVGSITTSFNVNWTPNVNSKAFNKSTMTVPKSHISNTNPFFPLQWSHLAINSHDAWSDGYKGNGAVVAVIDGGFFPNHPDIKNNVNISLSKNFVAGESLEQAFDGFGHGTHCAGIIAALDNDIGTVGVAPEAELILVKVLADAGYGSFEDVAAGIVYAADQGVDIISMSLGANIPRTLKDPVNVTNEIRALINFVNKAVKYAEGKGVTVIVAAGNEAQDPTQSGNLVTPVGAPGAIGISALGPRGWGDDPTVSLDDFASYSNWGTNIIEISGSGGDFTKYPDGLWFFDMVISPSGYGDYYFAAGTSMATPQVAGVAALIVGKHGSMKPSALKAKLIKCTNDLGKTGRDEYYGHGRINAFNAVK